jgi:pimeloyl-ACP methyl ester carboxylesterase
VLDSVFWGVRQIDGAFGMREWLTTSRLRTHYSPRSTGWRSGGPVVLVLAGLATPWRFRRPVLNALSDRGYRVVVLPQLGWNLRPVAELAATVERYLDAHPELGRVLIVGHSKGGLIAKQVLLDDLAGDRTIGAVAVAAPFGGARAARFVHGSHPITREMIGLRAGTPMQLAFAMRDGADARIASIMPLYDQIVGIPGKLRAGRNLTVRALGHNLLLADRRVHDILDRELRALIEHDTVVRSS